MFANSIEPLAARQKALPLVSHTDDVAKQHNLYTDDKMTMRGMARIYYADHKQKGEVMRAQDNRISTATNDPKAVSIMLDLAESRGWDRIKLSGSTEFKREAWIQALARGIEVDGYKPTQTDRQEAGRRVEATTPTERSCAEPPTVRDAPKPPGNMTDEELGNYIRQKNPELFDQIKQEMKNRQAPPEPQADRYKAADYNPDAHREAAEAKRVYAQQEREEGFRKDLGFRSRDDQRADERAVWKDVETHGASARGGEVQGQKQVHKPAAEAA